MDRNALDSVLREHFEELVKHVHKERKAYATGQNPSRAQLWCAVAVLAKEISDLRLKVKSMEKHITVKSNISLKRGLRKL